MLKLNIYLTRQGIENKGNQTLQRKDAKISQQHAWAQLDFIVFLTLRNNSIFIMLLCFKHNLNCTARQCSPLRRKFMECYIIKPAQSLLMKHLVYIKLMIPRLFIGHHAVIGFHWSAFRNHQGSTFTEKDRRKLNYRIGPLWSDSVIELVSDLIIESDQAVRAVHSCNSWFNT